MRAVGAGWLRFGCADVKLGATPRRPFNNTLNAATRFGVIGMMAIPAAAADAIEADTVRKVRMRIIPLVFALFVIAVLDRNNIGFAALTMNKELGITSEQYGFIAGVFFFGYF
jgi:hypothetical protein